MSPRPENSVSSSNSIENATESKFVATNPIDKDVVVQVDDVLYDAMALARVHPGGELFLKAFSGFDATEAFLSYHRRQFPHNKWSEMRVGTAEPKKTDKHADKEYLELCNIIEQVLPRHKSFATASYYLKVMCIMGTSIWLELYIHTTGQYKWYLTAPLGLLFALIGLNIQHDANHGAVSRNPLVNRILGLGQNWIGGSAVDWIHQHVVQHHVNTNDVDHDPDIVGNAILRLSTKSPLASIHGFQYLYMFALLALFGLTYISDSFSNATKQFNYVSYSKLIDSTKIFEQGTILAFTARWAILPFILTNSSLLSTALNILPLLVVGGYYLSFFFILSHNFEGVHMFDEEFLKNNEQSFLRKQCMTSSNVGGSLLCTMNGGLNYQIEHHLFPRMSHVHYPTIAPIVRTFCESKGIPYVHFPTVWDNVRSCSAHLWMMGNKEIPVGFKGGAVVDGAK